MLSKNGNDIPSEPAGTSPEGQRGHFRAVRSETTDRRFETLLLMSASIVWWTNAEGEIVAEQPYWQEYTGQTWEEYRGSHWLAALHPDDRAAITADWNKALANGSMYFSQGRIWSAKFRCYRTFQTRGIPVRDDSGKIMEWLGALTDIQDTIDIKELLDRTDTDLAASVQALRASEAQYRESEARFRTMADSAPVLIWMSGLDKLCTFFNLGWLRFTGRPLEAEMGAGWLEGVHADDVSQCLESYSAAFDARRRFEIEYRLRRHDGEYRWVIDRGVPRYDSNGEFCGYIGSALDINDRKQLEENQRHFAHMQRLALIGELSAAIAHEVRQPLNAILLHANAGGRILRSPQPEDGNFLELRAILFDIESDARRADDVMQRIRRFLRKREPTMEAIDVNALVTDAVRLASEEVAKRKVNVDVDLTLAHPQVAGDHTQLMQVLLNLILNAMDAMEKTNAPERNLELRTKREGDAVVVSVSDRGTGISPEAIPQLFESFFTTKSDGMGLGLSIAKSIVNAHQGRIWAKNNDHGGATFCFTLPVAKS